MNQVTQEPELDFGDPSLNDTEQGIMDGLDDGQQTQPDATQTEDPTPPADAEGAGNDTDTPKAGEGSAAEPPAQQQPAQAEPHSDRANADAKGNLVDAKGNIIASAGRERRIFERSERLAKQVNSLNAELTQLRQQAEAQQQLQGIPQQLGLTTDEVSAAYNIMGNFKKDPVAVAKWALQETLAMGYTLAQITGEGENSIEMSAIRKMIDDRVGPVVQEREQAQQNTQAQARALREYNTFLTQHPNADVHEDTIVQMMNADKSLTPQSAYWRLTAYAAQRGLDFTQPLAPQVAAQTQRAQAASQPAPAPAQQQPAQRNPAAPMPNGASPTTTQRSATQQFADPSSDYEDIIAGVMREAGMR